MKTRLFSAFAGRPFGPATGAALLAATLACTPPEDLARTPPTWASGATCYEIFVRSFADSDGDGMGDLKGLTARLDYLNDGDPATRSDLGVRCLWLMPVAEAPSYHGYDPVDHYAVERDYGTTDEFKRFVAEAHRRGMVVLVDMVLNHVSSDYPAFQKALADPAAPERRLFRFQPEKGPLNKWGGDNWHTSPLRDEYYYGFFWKGMPDLNYEDPDALEEMRRVATYWLTEMDVDGFRLDAVKFLVEADGQADDTPGTHQVLRDYQAHLMRTKPGVFTIGEVFDSTAALLTYYGDQLDGYFAFEIGDSILAGVRDGRGTGIVAPAMRLAYSVPAWRWSPFLRNHDQPRTATVLGGDLAKAKVAAVLQFTMPGLPFVYYGEELGMTGDKPDELIRTPMAWTMDAPHAGFTSGTPWQPLAADSLRANVGAQQGDPESLHRLYATLIHARREVRALAEGTLILVESNTPDVVAFIRRAGDEAVLVVANVGVDHLRGLKLSAGAASLPPGANAPLDLLTGPGKARWVSDAASGGPIRATAIPVAADGSFRDYTPMEVMPRQTVFVFRVR
ncbi:MAG: alpha-amylase [Gemmatimonadetes bacterium]|nr:alpha-amylase [Gemmatimonadota bacterium]